MCKPVQLKAVCFDLGDTLILTDRWDYNKCLKKLLKSLQHDNVMVSTSFKKFRHAYFEVRHQMYLESEQSLKEVDFRQRIARTLKKFNYTFNYENPIVTRAVENFVKTFIKDVRMENYVPPLLTKLKNKYKLGLVSNFAYAPGFWRTLQHFNLTRYFDAIVVSGELGLRKPHPKIFEEALKKLNVKAAETVFVGDSLKADINGAKRDGFKTVLVENIGLKKSSYEIPSELDSSPVKPDARIPNLRELPKILKIL